MENVKRKAKQCVDAVKKCLSNTLGAKGRFSIHKKKSNKTKEKCKENMNQKKENEIHTASIKKGKQCEESKKTITNDLKKMPTKENRFSFLILNNFRSVTRIFPFNTFDFEIPIPWEWHMHANCISTSMA